MKRLVLVIVCVGALVVPATSADAATPRCHGQRATIVGSPGQTVTGTQRRDVVVTHGADDINTLGGDDLICVTRGRAYTEVESGRGDDTVLVVSARGRVAMQAGVGADVFRGGPERDTFTSVDGGDDVSTGRNADDVEIDTSHEGSRIELGAGRDRLVVYEDGRRAWTSDTRVDAGAGTDVLQLRTNSRSRDAGIDNPAGLLTLAGRTTPLSWGSVERFDLAWARARTLSLIGRDDVSEEVVIDGYQGAEQYELQLGGGDDDVYALSDTQGSVDGGQGVDTFRSAPDIDDPTGLVADLSTGSLVATHADHQRSWVLAGIEDLVARTYLGSAYPTVVLRGDGGPNRLVGSDGDDTLDGGPGEDVVDGRGGTDTCYAETTSNCEGP